MPPEKSLKDQALSALDYINPVNAIRRGFANAIDPVSYLSNPTLGQIDDYIGDFILGAVYDEPYMYSIPARKKFFEDQDKKLASMSTEEKFNYLKTNTDYLNQREVFTSDDTPNYIKKHGSLNPDDLPSREVLQELGRLDALRVALDLDPKYGTLEKRTADMKYGIKPSQENISNIKKGDSGYSDDDEYYRYTETYNKVNPLFSDYMGDVNINAVLKNLESFKDGMWSDEPDDLPNSYDDIAATYYIGNLSNQETNPIMLDAWDIAITDQESQFTMGDMQTPSDAMANRLRTIADKTIFPGFNIYNVLGEHEVEK